MMINRMGYDDDVEDEWREKRIKLFAKYDIRPIFSNGNEKELTGKPLSS
jgi:hypothetical protein